MKTRSLVLFALLVTGSASQAQFFNFWNERFDTYATGAGPAGSGGWTGWFGNNALQGNISTTVACSGPRSAFVSGNTDVVRPLSGFTSGRWIAKTSVYVPSSGGTGKTWWSVLNTYNPGTSTFSWSVALSFDRATGQVKWESGGANQGVGSTPSTGPGTLPLVLDQWVDVWSEINLFTNKVSTYYNQQLIATTDYKPTNTSPSAIVGINLYCENPTAAAYHDNLCVVRDMPRLWRRGKVDNFNGFIDPFYVRPGLKTYVQTSNPNPFWSGFDQAAINRTSAFSFIGLPMGPCASFKGDLKVRARAVGNATNDTFNISPTDLPPFQYANTFAHAAGNSWFSTPPQTLSWNLGRMPANVNGLLGNTNLLPNINVASYLNWYSQDDTQLDFADLRLWTCRPWFRGFQLSPIGSVLQIARGDGKIDLQLDPTVPSGIELETGDSRGGGIAFENLPELRTAGTNFQIGAEGRVGGNDWYAQAYLNFAGAGTHATAQADFSGVNSNSQEVAILNANDQVIHSFVQANNAPVTITGNARVVKGWKGGGTLCVRFGGNTVIGGVPNGVTMCFVPRGPIAGWAQPAQAIALRSTGISGYTVAGAGTSVGNAYVNADGGGTLSVEPTSVTLNGLTDGSESKVVFNSSFNLDINPPKVPWKKPELPCTLPGGVTPTVGTKWEYDANAVFANGNRSTAVKATLNGNGSSWDVNVDFAGSGGTGGNLKLYRNGSLIASFLNVPNGNWGTFGSNPGTVISDPLVPVCIKVLPEDEASGANFTHNSISYTVDRVEFSRVAGGSSIVGYESVGITTANIEELVIENPVFRRALTGKINANGRIAGTYAGLPVTVELVDSETQALLETLNTTLAADGSFEVLTGVDGLVDVYARSTPFLRKKVGTMIGEFGPGQIVFASKSGDADGDNEVGGGDFAVLSEAWDTVLGEPNYNRDADFDGDDEIGGGDFAVLSTHYDQTGD